MKIGIGKRLLILLFLFVFLFGSLHPAPVLAADAIRAWSGTPVAEANKPGIMDKIVGFLTPDEPQRQPAQEDEKKGFWEEMGEYLGIGDDENENGTAQATDILPRKEKAPKGEKMAKPKRVKELKKKRTARAKFYKLEDGRVQAEIAGSPIHYKDQKGNWHKIDTRIQSADQPGFSYGNEKNTFQSFFGKKSDKLVRFKRNKRQLTLGVKGKGKSLSPEVKEDTVTYPDVFGEADLVYQVTSDALKEKIVLEKAPKDAAYTFTVKMGGVKAKKRKDGSIAFYRKSGEGDPVFIIPKPFMIGR
ncbi:hypothetical protein [Paludifilum halophilum]|uniref:Uncharacterized protein n=1 Tax=Paludifilum halophilum TaxID=1642702 RepID=A0A235BBW9_9BACL|nr:hypothetical protein [Paludifilum halophilum]OYD09075.1 hypothetical protein CHM34_04735 [Paludifilum halophilum]